MFNLFYDLSTVPQVKQEYLKCNKCAAEIEVPSAQVIHNLHEQLKHKSFLIVAYMVCEFGVCRRNFCKQSPP
jgi:Fe2+ or Zn2+ uptake regulation protein